MTTYHVRVAGSNTPDPPYEDWANAANDIEDVIAETLGAGDIILVESTYSETYGENKTLTFGTDVNARTEPVEIISCGDSNTTYLRGAELKATSGAYDLIIQGDGVVIYGFDLEGGDDIFMGEFGSFHRYVDCHLVFAAIAVFVTNSHNIFDNCTFTSTELSYVFASGGDDSLVQFNSCTFTMLSLDGNDSLFWSFGSGAKVIFDNCDLSSASFGTFTKVLTGISGASLVVRRSTLHANFTKLFTSISAACNNISGLLEGCYSGTKTDPTQWKMRQETVSGLIEAVDTEYRTGGATDGETPHSWKMQPGATVNHNVPLATPPMGVYVDAGAQDITLYFSCGTSILKKHEFWIEVSSSDESIPADAQGRWQSTQSDLLVTNEDCDIDGSVWNGSAGGYEQSLSISINPTEACYVTVRAFLAKDQDVWVDPKIESSTKDGGDTTFSNGIAITSPVSNITKTTYLYIN